MGKYERFIELPSVVQDVFMRLCCLAIIKGRDDDLERIKQIEFDYGCFNSPIELTFYATYDILCHLNGYANYQLIPQYDVVFGSRKYILDFAYISNDFKLGIECDGHEFHEKTKEQVDYGNNRDYDLQKNGFQVLHFSGSQLYNEPIKCARKVIDFIKERNG